MNGQKFILHIVRVALDLIALTLMVVGIRHVPQSLELLQHWQDGREKLPSVCLGLTWVTIPSTVGFFLLLFVERSFWTNQRTSNALSKHCDTPWLAVPQWASKRICLSNQKYFLVFAGSLWAYVTNLAPLLIGLEWSSTKWMIGIGVYCLIMAIFRYWRESRWNSAELQLATLPGVIGGPFSAAFLIRQRFPPDTIFEASLRCTYRIPSDGDSSHEEKIHWSSTIEVKALPSADSSLTAVPLSFAIPFQCPSSQLIDSPSSEWNHVRWTLKVRHKNPFATAVSMFVVPIYRTSDSQVNYEPDESLLAPFQVPTEISMLLARNGIERQTLADGTLTIRIYRRDPFRRNVGIALFTVCSGIIAACIYWIGPIELKVFACFIPFFIAVIGIHVVLEYVLWNCTFRNRDQQLEVVWGIRGLQKRWLVPRDSTTVLYGKLMTRSEVAEFWDLFLRRPDWKSFVLFKAFSRNEIETIQSWLGTELGIGIEKLTIAS